MRELKDGTVTATEDIKCNEHVSQSDLITHLDFVLNRLEEEGKIVLIPMSFGDVVDCVQIELVE